ncbi:putative splicing factor, arginine/serine-rich 6 [Madurella mycetomatis]|uniref:Splicing factor, arginine/serine-rich 6 n=1 Tax=Madurella mycetomatis TaxID=100816 RepID=A0A175W0P9_9PEZI|nr:putative splicing factor, arginine/serine-rich 6 [Madurella mycetomatis]
MLGQSPELVAASSLSPLSPAPIPVQTPAVVPKLQDQAASTDEAASYSATPPSAPHHPAAMPPNRKPADAPGAIVVDGDGPDGSHDESDVSIDYGEGEEGREREQLAPDAANDDYARTFDSPADRQDQSEAGEAQPDVSMATESMNSPSAPDPLTSQSPAAAAPPSDPPSPPPPSGLPATNGPAEGTSAPSEHASSESSSEPLPSDSAPDAAQPSTVSATAGVKENTSTVSAPAAASAPAPANEDDASVDIQKLVDDITARGAATASPPKPPAPATPTTTQAVSATPAPSYPSSLPPKPAVPLPPGNLPAIPQPHHSFQTRGPNASAHSAVSMNIASPATPHHGTYMSAGAPGVGNEVVSSLPPPPPPTFGGPSHTHAHLQNAHHMPIARDASSGNYHGPSIKHQWEAFQADEKRYTSEAKWERFPEGSRIFIGNLSSERVSKREVFDVFHKFGRLAQISLKNAYGFVQYHTVAEGQAAMQGAQGIELGGRKIHLEISRTQKKKDDRDRSPDRRTPRGGRGSDRYDNGDRGWRRDDYRPVRSPSPRRSDGRGSRDGLYSRDRDLNGAGHERRRSRSPARFNRYDNESYRRRSPSPHRRAPSDGGRLEIPRRYGPEVPDVQVLLLQEVSKDFVEWVRGAFHHRGLKTDVMYLNPRFPRDTVVERQVVEGVHAIVDLDYTAQSQGRIPIQVFIRSGSSSVRFELYQGIEPTVAAELVLREKSQAGAHLAQSRPAYTPSNYGQSYPAEAPPAGYQYPYSQWAAPPAQPQPAPPTPDLVNMVGQLDNSALQALLASLQTPQAGHAHPSTAPAPAGAPQAAHIDVNALLGNLRNAAAAQATPAPGVPSYGAPPTYASPVGGTIPGGHSGIAGLGGGDTAQQVQTIIDQLKRAAQ